MFKSSLIIIFLLFSQQASSASTSILVFGDSLSAAYNLPTDQGWVALLKNQLSKKNIDVIITNASISGETSSGGLVRFESQLAKTKPDIVILELGANDGLRGFDLKTTHANLLSMINSSHNIQATVLLAGIHIPPNYGRTYTQKFDNIYLNLSKMEHVTLIPFILENVATNADLMLDDGLHPNKKGQSVVLENVLEFLMPLLASRNE